MEWKVLRDEGQIDDIIRDSAAKPQVIFKHSTRCSISAVAKGRLDRAKASPDADFYYLDLISFKSISNKVAQVFGVHHESPQILIIRDGVCVYDDSHMGISMDGIAAALF